MIYEYKCSSCGSIDEISKSYKECSSIEVCKHCGSIMDRSYTVPNVVISSSYYSNILGGSTDSGSVSEMQRRYHDRTGSEMIPVGDQSSKVAPKKISYELPREILAKVHEQ